LIVKTITVISLLPGDTSTLILLKLLLSLPDFKKALTWRGSWDLAKDDV